MVGFVCLLGAVGVACLTDFRSRRLEFINGDGAFKIQSVRVSRGTSHTDFYPNGMQFVKDRIVRWPNSGRPVFSERVKRTTPVETIGLWIRWKSRTGDLSPRDINVQWLDGIRTATSGTQDAVIPLESLGAIGRPIQRLDQNDAGEILVALASPMTRSGEFLFILRTNAWPNKNLVIVTPDGRATIRFQ